MTSKQHIHLYPYQTEMVSRIAKSLGTYRSVMVQMPTGTGKTHIIAAVTKSYISKGHTVFVIAHRRELVAQAQNTLHLYIDENGMKKVGVYSVQWLNRHISEITSKPSLIVIDEAHHSVAKTYTSIIEAFPKAKIMGLTATPCRLNGYPFTDLFDVLLQSHPINWFIAEGYLSLYDYMSVRPDNEDVRIINSLRKRGADGDFSVREMSEKLDIRPSLERLCDTITRYVKGKKGIVYAIDINHAEHIAEIYQKNGIKAIALSSKTPDKDREEILERFRNTQTGGKKSLTSNPQLRA